MTEQAQRIIIAITSFDIVVSSNNLLLCMLKYFSSDSIIQIIIKNLRSYDFLARSEDWSFIDSYRHDKL